MFTARADAFLRICYACRFPYSLLLSQKDRHELVHASIGEKQIRCVREERRRRHNGALSWSPLPNATNLLFTNAGMNQFGASGRSDDDGTMVCCFSRKKSRNDCRISADVMMNTVLLLVYCCFRSH